MKRRKCPGLSAHVIVRRCDLSIDIIVIRGFLENNMGTIFCLEDSREGLRPARTRELGPATSPCN